MAKVLLLDTKQTLHSDELNLIFVTIAHSLFYKNNHPIQVGRIAQTIEDGTVTGPKDAKLLAIATVAALPGPCLARYTAIVRKATPATLKQTMHRKFFF